jgi:hypothetical protein
MTSDLINKVLQVDKQICRHDWFDFHVLKFDNSKLVIGGGVDLTYFHTLEIIFDDVFFVSAFFKGWRSDTRTIVFSIPDNVRDLNLKFKIENGYQLFKFTAEDYAESILIAARDFSFNTDTVFYYDRQNLKDNERLADFVKTKNAL